MGTLPLAPEPSFSKDLSLQVLYLISFQKYKYTAFCNTFRKYYHSCYAIFKNNDNNLFKNFCETKTFDQIRFVEKQYSVNTAKCKPYLLRSFS